MMRTPTPMSLTDPLDVSAPPHLRGGDSYTQMTLTTLAVALLAGATGVALFGQVAAVPMVISMTAAVTAEWLYSVLTRRRITPSYDHAALMGLLMALTLPVGRWDGEAFRRLDGSAAALGGMVAVLVGKGLMGGMGNYLWQPALVGRVAAEVFYSRELHPDRWVVLGYRHLMSRIPHPVEVGDYLGWRGTLPPDGANAWVLRRPVEWLRQLADGPLPVGGENPLTVLLRDGLPPWEDTLLGGVGGGIGETCSIALIVGGVYLIYRGYVRWRQPACVLLGAAMAAAILPVRIGPEASLAWMPGFVWDQGLPVGAVYVLYHLTGGELLLGAFLLSTDTVSSPRTPRGQTIFGLCIGVLTILLRLYGTADGACYWAILIMNTFSGAIDRRTRRRVMGTQGLAP